MKLKQIKLFDPHVTKHEKTAIEKVLQSHFWASGAGVGKVLQFENMFNAYVNSKFCVALNNGTSALHLALSLFDIRNKEVVVPSLSFVSTVHAIVYNGGKPVFVDVEPNSLCIDTDKLKKCITNKTRAILPVHFAGMPCNLKEIMNLCHEHGLALVEDAAHAAGASYNGKRIGTHGNAVCFSFHPVKNLAMPTGGAVTLNGSESSKMAEILKRRRWCGISNRKGVEYDVTEIGWNYYMNEFSAAIGVEQLKRLDAMNEKRRCIAKRYEDEITLEEKIPFDSNCAYHLYWIRVKNRDNFRKKMLDNNIETGIHYKPIHKMSFYKGKQKLPVTEKVGNEVVSIPIHPNLTDGDVTRIIKTINRFSR